MFCPTTCPVEQPLLTSSNTNVIDEINGKRHLKLVFLTNSGFKAELISLAYSRFVQTWKTAVYEHVDLNKLKAQMKCAEATK